MPDMPPTHNPRIVAPVHKIEKPGERGSTARGYNYRWQKVRLLFLKKNPLCKHCLEEKPQRITKATDVDHIVPHRGDNKLFWDENNWQALCKEHHSIKTAKEDGGFGNARIF